MEKDDGGVVVERVKGEKRMNERRDRRAIVGDGIMMSCLEIEAVLKEYWRRKPRVPYRRESFDAKTFGSTSGIYLLARM